jgi:hypothetical protein
MGRLYQSDDPFGPWRPGPASGRMTALVPRGLSVLLPLAVALVAASSAAGSGGTTFAVTSTADSGGGTLRDAITLANAHKGADTIIFALGSGDRTIHLDSALPTVTSPVRIDGTTQTAGRVTIWGLGFSGGCLDIDRPGSGTVVDHLGFTQCGIPVGAEPNANNVVFQDLYVHDNLGGIVVAGAGDRVLGCVVSGAAEGITTEGTGVLVSGNLVGTDQTGTAPGPFQTYEGIRVLGSGNTIENNLVSGATTYGIDLDIAGLTKNVVRNNKVGTDVTGTVAIPNHIGIEIKQLGVLVAGNLVSGNSDAGVESWYGQTTLTGNRIGTNAAGTAALPNGSYGIHLTRNATPDGSANVVGGNLVSGNGRAGVYSETEANVFQGNRIGTNASGTAAIPNQGEGISSLGSRALIGGAKAGMGNLVSGNAQGGIDVGDHSTVQGNLVGTAADGTSPLGNGGDGILYWGPSNLIGGAKGPTGNVVAFNGGNGVLVTYGSITTVQRNAIHGNAGDGISVVFGGTSSFLANAISGNGGLGIDLGDDGITPNDPGDADTGVNGLQNFPTIVSAVTAKGKTTLNGALHSTPAGKFRIEIFANHACDASGYGEGGTFLYGGAVKTDSAGDSTFSFKFNNKSGLGTFTATATNLTTGETSELASCA